MSDGFALSAGIWAWVLCAAVSAAQAPGPADLKPQTKVVIDGQKWLINDRPTCEGSPAEGLLMNVRMVNAVFEDRGQAGDGKLPEDFDPETNTAAFIAQIPNYAAHGIRAFSINLQGGMPGYEGAVNSAYRPDGSLRPAYMRRAARVIEACDRTGVVVILGCFYQRQSQNLSGRAAIENAVRNVAAWVRKNGYTNVVLEIANEFGHRGYQKWTDGKWLASAAGQVHLMKLARLAAPGLPVSTSGLGDGAVADDVAEEADFILIHFNDTALADIPAKIERMRKFGKPVVCNEDTKVGKAGAAAARTCVENGASWGLMCFNKNQKVPFEFRGAADDPITYGAMKEQTEAD